MSVKWENYTFKYLYKIASILPITIILALLILIFIIDLVYYGLSNNSIIGSN